MRENLSERGGRVRELGSEYFKNVIRLLGTNPKRGDESFLLSRPPSAALYRFNQQENSYETSG